MPPPDFAKEDLGRGREKLDASNPIPRRTRKPHPRRYGFHTVPCQ
jgi:hypothetical protein